jgi:hypothetical protein
MSLTQQLTEFRFNLETFDLLNSMGKSSDYSNQMLGELGFSTQLVKFMQSYRMLLNSVLLRLQLYSEQNLSEQKIRSSLAILNNPSVNSLLDYLYKNTSTPKETKKSSGTSSKTPTPPPTPVVEPEVSEHEEEVKEEAEEAEEAAEEDVDENPFDNFFSSCVRQSDDASHTVKMSAMYDKFCKWWSDNYEDETPTKDELKEYLSERLGNTIKSIVSNVSLA